MIASVISTASERRIESIVLGPRMRRLSVQGRVETGRTGRPAKASRMCAGRIVGTSNATSGVRARKLRTIEERIAASPALRPELLPRTQSRYGFMIILYHFSLHLGSPSEC